MATYRNANFKRRDYDTTNVVACVADAPPSPHYLPAPDSVLIGLTPLWNEQVGGLAPLGGGGRILYYGYL